MNAGGSEGELALIVGGGPGISSSCARRFRRDGMRVAVAARTPDKPVLVELEKEHGVQLPQDVRGAVLEQGSARAQLSCRRQCMEERCQAQCSGAP